MSSNALFDTALFQKYILYISEYVDHRVIPRTIFTDPQIGIVGVTDEEAVTAGHNCWCNTVSVELVPRAGAIRDTYGGSVCQDTFFGSYPLTTSAKPLTLSVRTGRADRTSPHQARRELSTAPQNHFLDLPVVIRRRACCGQVMPGRRRRRAKRCPASGRPSKIPGHWGLVLQRLMRALVIVEADVARNALACIAR